MEELSASNQESGPSARAVSLARAWLVVIGALWLVFGLGAMISGADFLGLPLLGIVVGAVSFAGARFASARLAVFLALS